VGRFFFGLGAETLECITLTFVSLWFFTRELTIAIAVINLYK